MSTKHDNKPRKSLLRRSVRFCLSSVASLTIAAVILWSLIISNTDPKARLDNLYITESKDQTNPSLVYNMTFINENYFRGFNFTYGWIEFFYVGPNTKYWIAYNYIPKEYQGFRNNTPWNGTVNNWQDSRWLMHSESLKKNQSYIYVSMYLAYFYKILFWTTTTNYYQWIEAKAYLNGTLGLQNVTDFERMKYFKLGISTST